MYLNCWQSLTYWRIACICRYIWPLPLLTPACGSSSRSWSESNWTSPWLLSRRQPAVNDNFGWRQTGYELATHVQGPQIQRDICLSGAMSIRTSAYACCKLLPMHLTASRDSHIGLLIQQTIFGSSSGSVGLQFGAEEGLQQQILPQYLTGMRSFSAAPPFLPAH